MKKRVLSGVLTVILCAGLSVPVAAEEILPEVSEEIVDEIEESDIYVTVFEPEEIISLQEEPEDVLDIEPLQVGDTENGESVTQTLSLGMAGDEVLALQQMLAQEGFLIAAPDGWFGGYTERAVKMFQLYNGLSVTGIADEGTTALLFSENAVSFYNQMVGSTGDITYQLQWILMELGYLQAPPDGIFGELTRQAVMQFQAANEIYQDGIAGRFTFDQIFREPVVFTPEEPPAEELSLMMSGDSVYTLQKKLMDLGYLMAVPDGWFGSFTERAVKKFQLYNGITVTGIADTATLQRMSTNDVVTFHNLAQGEFSPAVWTFQLMLKELGYLQVEADGYFGNYTYQAVRKFQSFQGLTADGIAGFYTMEVLFNDPEPYDESQEESPVMQMARERLDLLGGSLYAAYKWAADIPYTYDVTGYTTSSAAIYGFTYGVGDCIAKAATFCWMARALGYECNVIYGSVPYARGGYGEHAWTEIVVDGTTYVCDPDFEWDEGRNGYMIYYGQSGTWRYVYGYIMSDE